MRIILGLIMFAAGGAVTIYNEKMLSIFGRVEFAEKYLQNEGGSRLFYSLLGILVALAGITVTVGVYDEILLWLLLPIFGGLK
jgi:hypothetical protein